METQVSEGPVVHGNHADADYDGFLARVQARFLSSIEGGAAPLFETDAADLWGAYLGTPDEILLSGPLADVREEITRVRAEAAARKGWMFDTYLLRRAGLDG